MPYVTYYLIFDFILFDKLFYLYIMFIISGGEWWVVVGGCGRWCWVVVGSGGWVVVGGGGRPLETRETTDRGQFPHTVLGLVSGI